MRLAIFGVGQLARMMAQAAKTLDIDCVFIRMGDESTQCIDGLGDVVLLDNYCDDKGAYKTSELYDALGQPQCVTVEKENVPVEALLALQDYCNVRPCPSAVEATQHRGKEKQLLETLEIPTTTFAIVYKPGDLISGAEKVGYPLFAKSLVNGYDGKNQWQIRSDLELSQLEQQFPAGGVILEARVNFQREISFIGVRDHNGNIACYPVADNRHDEGVLISSIAPAQEVPTELVSQGESYLRKLLDHWQYVGVLAMECFLTESDLLINELAPRVHNSGHWTLQAGVNSQFENHVRAVCGMPLASTEVTGYLGMVNILGYFHEDQKSQLSALNADLYLYQKTSKPRRKIGHVTLRNNNYHELSKALKDAELVIYQNGQNSGSSSMAS
ncbi:MAG: 5-(carboxyamino)imidazole ribonucleotide synthase [Pseudomonadales bacterium]|nr:5-(carboxyamino)imidazole ribonucleotide synthase [Pseudomonadales bacterium]